jgi:hypothetical protein
MDMVASLSHKSKFKDGKDKIIYSIGIHFNIVQNSSGNYEEWHYAKSFKFYYQG